MLEKIDEWKKLILQDDARGLLDELKYIPKEIQLLKEDMEATASFAVSKTLKNPKK